MKKIVTILCLSTFGSLFHPMFSMNEAKMNRHVDVELEDKNFWEEVSNLPKEQAAIILKTLLNRVFILFLSSADAHCQRQMKNAKPSKNFTPKNVEKEALFTINGDDLRSYIQRPIEIRFDLEDVYISQLACTNSLDILKKIDLYTERRSPRLNFRTLRFFSDGSTKMASHIQKIINDLRSILEELNSAFIGESSTREIEKLFYAVDEQIKTFCKDICTLTAWEEKINTILSGLKKINTFFHENTKKEETYFSVTEKIKRVKNEFKVFEGKRDLFLIATQQYFLLFELLTNNCHCMFDFYKKIVSKLNLSQNMQEELDLKNLLLLLNFDANNFDKNAIKIVSKKLDDVLKFLLTLKNKEAVKKNIHFKNIDILKGLDILCDSNKKLAINDDKVILPEDKKRLENSSSDYLYVPLMWYIVNCIKKKVDYATNQEEILLQKKKQREIEELLLACEISSSGSKSNKNKNNKNKNNKNKNNKNKKPAKSKDFFVTSEKKSSNFQQKTTTTNTTSSSDTIVPSLISKETFEDNKNFNIADFAIFHSIECSSVDKKHQLLHINFGCMGYNHVDCIIKKDALYNNIDMNTIDFESKMIEYREKNKLDLYHLAGLFVFKSFFNCAEIIDGQKMVQEDLNWYGLNDYGTIKDCSVCSIHGYLVTNKEIVKEIKNTKIDDFEDYISHEDNKITRKGFHAGHFILLYKKTTKEVRHVFFHESLETKKIYKSEFIL